MPMGGGRINFRKKSAAMNRSWSEGEKKGRVEDWKGRGLAWMGQEEIGDLVVEDCA